MAIWRCILLGGVQWLQIRPAVAGCLLSEANRLACAAGRRCLPSNRKTKKRKQKKNKKKNTTQPTSWLSTSAFGHCFVPGSKQTLWPAPMASKYWPFAFCQFVCISGKYFHFQCSLARLCRLAILKIKLQTSCSRMFEAVCVCVCVYLCMWHMENCLDFPGHAYGELSFLIYFVASIYTINISMCPQRSALLPFPYSSFRFEAWLLFAIAFWLSLFAVCVIELRFGHGQVKTNWVLR